MIPSIEYLRHPGYAIVSDACIACDGPVRSVKLYGRVPVERIRTLGVGRGLAHQRRAGRILLKERFGVSPEIQPLPIGASLDDVGGRRGDAHRRPGHAARPAAASSSSGTWARSGRDGRACRSCSPCGLPGRESICGESRRRWPLPATTASTGWRRLPGRRPRRSGFRRQIALSYLRDHLTFHLGHGSGRGWNISMPRLAGDAHEACAPARSRSTWSFHGRQSTLNQANGRLHNEGNDLRNPRQSVAGQRLDAEEGLALLRVARSGRAGRAADAVTRRLHPEPFRTYNIDRNINYTNICTSGCRFCASRGRPGDRGRLRHHARRVAPEDRGNHCRWAATRSSCRAGCTPS